MTRVYMSHKHESLPPKNIGLNTINTLGQIFQNPNLPPSSPPSPCQPRTHLRFSQSNYLKPVLAPQPDYSMLDEAAGRTHACKPLQFKANPASASIPTSAPPQPLLRDQVDVRYVNQPDAPPPTQAYIQAPTQQTPPPPHIHQYPEIDLAQVMQALYTLTQGLATLIDNVNRFIQNSAPVNIPALILRPKSYVQCPATYNGKTPADARRFLVVYKAWASN